MCSKITRFPHARLPRRDGGIKLFLATALGILASTTHTITGAIVGVGASRRITAVRWNVTQSIVVAWIVTMPAAALVAALGYGLSGLFR